MWGEIEPPVRTQQQQQQSQRDSEEERSGSPEDTGTPTWRYDPIRRSDTELPQDIPFSSQAESTCVNAMLDAVASSGRLVKSQQVGEAELSLEQRRRELQLQYTQRPLVFLERYHACLKPQDMSAFAHVCSDPRALHYSGVIQKRDEEWTNRTRVRNQRYAALRVLQTEGQYFSEEQMRIREPLLYEQYIGQYLTDEEVLERSQEAMLDGAPGGAGGPGAPAGGPGGLAHLLLNSYQERLIQNRLQEEQEREEGALEEDEDDEDDDNRVQEKEKEPTAEEKTLLREEFISQMHQRFLDGKDKDFNYSEVDENPDYDNLDIVNRDAEEKYFDDDEEEEDEEDMMD
ncbi:coiled-coil domain-containing protein 97 [Limanda limanda]|uniref:coiled-coil domain-containing protein 97 n=1 Tax=Limanda limanda TaxID=27771 RepID=UPI0029C8083B|nr:coiled-coil domain-containing protein 97 [Limanda limanda]